MDALYRLAVMVSALDKFTSPVQKMAKSYANFEATIKKGQGMVDFGNKMAVSGALVGGAAEKITGALGSLAQPVASVEDALGEVASVGIKDLKALQYAATKFSSQWSGTTEAEFISAAYDIKGGIESLSDAAIAEYTRIAALTGKATKSTTAEMTNLFATGYGIYKDMYSDMSDMEFGEMFGAGITSAVGIFKSSGSGMSQALTSLGAAATSANRPFEEQLTVLGMLQATMSGSEAGTKYKAFIQSAARAGKTLGISFVDANNQLLSMPDILDKLRGKYGDTIDAMEKLEIQKAFGTDEAVALIDLLFPKTEQFRTSMDELGQSTRQGTAYIEGLAQTMNTGLGAQFQLTQQNLTILKREIGSELAPLLKILLPDVRAMVTGFQNLAKSHPSLVRTGLLLAVIAAVGFTVLSTLLLLGSGLGMLGGYTVWSAGQIGKGFKSIKGVVKDGLSVLGKGLKIIKPNALSAAKSVYTFAQSAIFAARRALPGLVASVWSFTAALLANPITWIVIGIIALIAAIYLLWRNWDKVTAALGRGWDFVKAKFAAARQWFAGVFQGLVGVAQQYGPIILAVLFPFIGIPLLIARNWDTIKATAANIFNNLVQLIPQKISEIITAIRNKGAEFLASGRALIESFVSGIQGIISRPAEVVREGLAKLRNLLPFSDAKEGPLSRLTYSGKALINTFASGIQARSPYLQAVAAGAFGNILPDGRVGSWGASPLGRTPSIKLREFIRESSRDREFSYTRDRRPIVVVVGGQNNHQGNFQEYIDLALRQLEMSGD